jgi:eukaryotic-like serine/threonine-protein kinase
VALQLCDALDAVHRAGVVHRDVKPSNVVVVREAGGDERFKLLDFGIARLEDPSQDKLTNAGTVLGTPAYMAPEQLVAAEQVDASSDVYGLGVVLFECLSGELPYSGNAVQVIARVVAETPTPPLEGAVRDVPQALARVVDRALAKKRDGRFRTATELATAIRLALPGVSSKTSLLLPRAVSAADPASPQQRRRTPRTPYNTPVRLVLADAALDARTEDISAGGALLVSRVACEPNRRGTLKLALPMDGKVVSVDVEVRWVRNAEGHEAAGLRAIGVEFVDPSPRVRESIGAYVQLMGDRPG